MNKTAIKHFILLLFFPILCLGQAVDDKSYSVADSIVEKTSYNDFIKAKKIYKNLLVDNTNAYKKVNGVIKLPTENKSNPYVIYKDTGEEDTREEYSYIGYFEQQGFYVVEAEFWENTSYYIIDKKTGHTESIWNAPILSPNGKYIANLSIIYGLEGMPNGFQVWKVNKKGSAKPITIVLQEDQQEWVPIDVVWENENTLLIKTTTPDNYLKNNGNPTDKDCYYLRYTL